MLDESDPAPAPAIGYNPVFFGFKFPQPFLSGDGDNLPDLEFDIGNKSYLVCQVTLGLRAKQNGPQVWQFRLIFLAKDNNWPASPIFISAKNVAAKDPIIAALNALILKDASITNNESK